MPLSKHAALSKDRASGKGVQLQHRHFAFIASVIADLPADIRQQVADAFARMLWRTNDNFDVDRFMLASGIELIESDKAAKEYEEILDLANKIQPGKTIHLSIPKNSAEAIAGYLKLKEIVKK